jgi:hypothetical protein
MHSIVLMVGNVDADPEDEAEGEAYVIDSSLTPDEAESKSREVLRLLIESGFRVVRVTDEGEGMDGDVRISDLAARNPALTLADLEAEVPVAWPS